MLIMLVVVAVAVVIMALVLVATATVAMMNGGVCVDDCGNVGLMMIVRAR